MKKKALIMLGFFWQCLLSAQVKIGQTPGVPDSRAVLELEHSSKGFLLPRLADTLAVTGGGVAGLVIYSTSDSTIYYHDGVRWLSMFSTRSNVNTATVYVDCSYGGFSAAPYVAGVALSGASYSVKIVNNSFTSVSISTSATDLQLSGAGKGSVTVGTPVPSGTVSIAAGATQIIQYPLSGTPSVVADTIKAVWTKGSLSCKKQTVTITTPPSFRCPLVTVTQLPAGVLSTGTTYTGSAVMSYQSANNTSVYPGFSQTIDGLTLEAPAGNYVIGSSTINYSLSGTYTGTSGSVTFTLPTGCTVYFGCGGILRITHIAGVNGSPESKTINYNVVYTDITGSNKCWLKQNLGATNIPYDITDSTRGWMFLFNNAIGSYINTSTGTINSGAYTGGVTANGGNWDPLNDPCKVMLGGGWRLPTQLEWINADVSQNWNNIDNTYASPLVLNVTGRIQSNGVFSSPNILSLWTTSSSTLTSAYIMAAGPSTATANANTLPQNYAMPVRCIKD